MSLSAPKYKIVFLFLVISLLINCSTYSPIYINKKLYFKNPGKGEKHLRNFVIKKEKKYLIKIPSIYSSSIINNKGVGLSLKGKFQMAENLFKESIIEYPHDPAAYNNLGIIYELFKNRKEAFKMYSKACLIDPQNLYFRKNFLTFVDSTKK